MKKEVQTVWRKCSVLALIVFSFSCSHLSKSSFIEQVYVIDENKERCLNCSSSDDLSKIFDVLEFRHSDEIAKYSTYFGTKDEKINKIFKKKSEAQKGFKGLCAGTMELLPLGTIGSFCKIGEMTLNYHNEKCNIPDCYKSFMYFESAEGNKIWEKRVAEVTAMVLPLVIDEKIVYFGVDKIGREWLYIYNLRNGKEMEKYSVGFGAGRVSTNGNDIVCPYFKDGFIVFEGDQAQHYDPKEQSYVYFNRESGEKIYTEKNPVYILKTNL